MFARMSTFQCHPSRVNELKSKIDMLMPQIESLPGIINVYCMWRDNGQGIVTSVYRSQRAAIVAAPRALAILGGLSELLESTPKTQTFDNVVLISSASDPS